MLQVVVVVVVVVVVEVGSITIVVQWNLYSVDTLGPAIFVPNREVSTVEMFKMH